MFPCPIEVVLILIKLITHYIIDSWARLHAPNEIVAFTFFPFYPFVKGCGSVDPYEAHGSIDLYEMIRGSHTDQFHMDQLIRVS